MVCKRKTNYLNPNSKDLNWKREGKNQVKAEGIELSTSTDKNSDSNGMNSFGGNEEVVVIVNDESEENKSRHARYDREESLHLWWLPLHPCRHRLDRRLGCLHARSLSLLLLLLLLLFSRKDDLNS
ncbi:unnamed protein product [Thlaspi arvense]|uniref:Uncharacterized protein n=1 Tax=Thlaspi arvense TaxID=13288 RepID=A0AAU9SGD7_THLAR|nr:unnamed protein product [Thlaspi arvense]